MKKLLFTLMFVSTNLLAQLNFDENIVIDSSNSVDDPTQIFSSDIDGDGDFDLVSTSNNSDKIIWFEYKNANYDTQHIVSINAIGVVSIFVTDFDGDTDMDIVAALYDQIIWYENIDGLGNFNEHVIDTTSIPYYVVSGDMDGDGDMDVVIASGYYGGKITWYENTDGLGNFSSQRLINYANYSREVNVTDIDNDGDLDVISITSNKVVLHENINNSGNFEVPEVISTNNSQLNSIYSTDIDGDGDIDILAAFSNIKIWYENNNGNFTSHTIDNFGGLVIYSSDIDNDGDMDIFSTKNNRLVWYENSTGLGDVYIEHLENSLSYTNSIQVVNLDNNGNSDIINSSKTYDIIYWHKSETIREIITQPEANGVRSACSADFDNDGDLDIVSASIYDGKITWYENMNGLGSFGSQQIISNNGAFSVYAADLNGDNIPDVASSGDNKITWYDNDGLGNFTNTPIVDIVSGENDIIAKDIDGDGDNDLISSSGCGNIIAWYKNTDGLGNFGTRQNISTTESGPIFVIDIDGDGDNDVLSSLNNSQEIVWYENLDGQGTFSTKRVLANVHSSFIYAIDIDNDGDNDILYRDTNNNSYCLYWLENDGIGNFSTQYRFENDIYTRQITAVFGGDLDSDGDIDIAFSSLNGTIGWFENLNGLGDFSLEQIITEDTRLAYSISLSDINLDGRLDVLTASQGDNKIAWFKNQSTQTINQNKLFEFTVFPIPTNDILRIKSKNEISKIELYNKLGQLMIINSNKKQIDISSLSKGLYFVKVESINKNCDVKKIIKK